MQNIPGKTIAYIKHFTWFRPVTHARPDHLRGERPLIELHTAIGADCRRKEPCNRGNEIWPSGDGIWLIQGYLPVYKAYLLANGEAQTFLARAGLYQARRKRIGHLVRIIDAIAAAEPVFGQHLGKAEVRFGGIEIGQIILVPKRHINIKETRLKGLRELFSTQRDGAVE